MKTGIDGEYVSEEYEKIALFMTKNNLVEIRLEYSGSGDSGEITDITSYELKDGKKEVVVVSNEIQDILEDTFMGIVSPNFNNSGSYGNASFTLEDGVLKFNCDHYDVIESTENSFYERDLLDTTLL